MFVMGGTDGQRHYFGDVWSSTDGKTWSLVTDSAGWGPRAAFAAVVHDSMIWVMGGTNLPQVRHNDVWCSTDGRDWTRVADSTPWAKRYGLEGLVLNGKIWILGGIADTSYPNDVWYSAGLGVSEEPNLGAGPTRVIRIRPNPFRRNAAVIWNSPATGGDVARVYAQDGRLVRQARLPAGQSRWVWDGRDDSGAPLPPGVYVLESGPGVRAKVVMTR